MLLELLNSQSHTLVIADHNGAFKPNEQASIRFTQPGAVLKDDSITRWHGQRSVGTSSLNLASWDYRSVDSHQAVAEANAGHGQPFALTHIDQAGVHTFETPADAQRLTMARRKQFDGCGTLRTLAPTAHHSDKAHLSLSQPYDIASARSPYHHLQIIHPGLYTWRPSSRRCLAASPGWNPARSDSLSG